MRSQLTLTQHTRHAVAFHLETSHIKHHPKRTQYQHLAQELEIRTAS